jgi:hypothetical protein
MHLTITESHAYKHDNKLTLTILTIHLTKKKILNLRTHFKDHIMFVKLEFACMYINVTFLSVLYVSYCGRG